MKKLITTCFILLTGFNHVHAGDIVVTTTGGVDEIIGNAIALTGAATGAPEASAASNSTTNSITTNITTITNNAWLIDIVGSSLNGSFTPDGSQTEQSDQQTGTTGNQRAQGTGASSTKQISPAGLSSMIQTHSSGAGTNDLVQAVAAVAPTATIAIDSTSESFTSTNNNTSLSWTHSFTDPAPDNKLMVGVVTEDRTNACTTGATLSGQSVEISSITHDGTNLTRIAYQTIRISIGGQDRCLRAELWYVDLDFPPDPQAEWRMDEGSWSGTTGEVSDNTGNGNDGTALNNAVTDNTSPAIAGDPGTCGYGDFPNNATTTPADAVDTGLTINSDIGNTGTITLWYNSNANWNGGGDRSILDAGIIGGTNGDIYFFLTLLNSGVLRYGYEDTADSDYRINSPVQAFTAGTWVHIAVTWDMPNDTQAIFINGTQVVSGSTAGDTNVMGALDTLYIGDNNGVYIIGGDTTANSANGSIDEVRVFDSVLSAAEITTVSNETHPCPSSNDITVTLSGNVDNINAGSISITNAAIGDPEATNTNTETNDGTDLITTTITTLTNNAWIIDTVGDGNAGSFTPGGTQTERWDVASASSTGAMSTEEIATAGLDSMSQTYNTNSNRIAHAVIAVPPVDSSSNIAFDAVASAVANSTSTISWAHALTTTNTSNTKLIVGITIEEPSGCSTGRVTSVTYGNINLTQAATVLVDDTYCHQVEIWYADLTNIIVSTDANSTLGGQAMDQDEAVEYDYSTDTGTLFFDDATFDSNARLDALHQYDNGNLAISVGGNGEAISGNSIPNGSIALVSQSVTSGVYSFSSILFDESNFASGDENIDAVYIRDNGNVVLSTNNNANLTGLGVFDDDDIVEWDGSSASLIFDIASITGAAAGWDVDGVHLLNDDENLILFSLYNDQTIGPTTYENGDVLLYNRNTSTLSIYFSEDNFTSGDEDVDAFTLAIPDIPPVTVDHYAISYPLGTPGVTCEALAVRITAHEDASDHSLTVAPSSSTTITLSTSPAADGWTLRSGNGTFSAPNQYTFDGTETFVDFWLTETTATSAPHIDIDVTDGTATDLDGVTEDDNIEFADAVFRFFDGGGTGESIETQISGKESDVAPNNETLQIRSVVTNTSTMACESRILNSQTIEMAYKCNNPTTCQGAPRVQIENASASTFDITPGNNNADTVDETNGNFSNVDLDFGASGTATFSFDFNDAGQIQLYARKDILASAPDPAYTIFGTSNQFVVKPAGLCVESTDTDSDCASADGSCSKFRKAGSVDAENYFNLTVRGVTWESASETNSDFCTGTNVTTPNFQLSSIALAHTKIAPVGGTSQDGTLSVTSLDITSSGTETESNQTISEVGVFTVTATPPSYIGETISTSTSDNIGRFYPDRFNVTMNNTPAFTDSCSSFTYIDQPFYYGTAPQLQITALNSNGNTTNNYGGSFWKLTGSTLSRAYADGSGTPPTATFSSTTNGSVTLAGETDFDGVGTLTLTTGSGGDTFMYQKGAPEALFDADVDVNFLASGFQDTDHEPTDRVCYDSTNDGTCDDFPHSMIQGTELRWGRMVLDNAFGSELLAVEVPVRVEYYTADGFVINTTDTATCTTYNSADMTFSNEDGVNNADLSVTGSGTLVNGEDDPANPILASSTANDTGSADLTIDLSAQDWLQYDWDNDGTHDNNPVSRVTWGIFAGPDEFIYIREPW